MFPPLFRRFLHVLLAVGVLSGLALGTSAVGASTPPTAASVITAVGAALAKQTGVHIVVNELAGKTKTHVVVDLGTTTGSESITSGQKHISIIITSKFVYVQGSATGLTGIMGLSAKQEKVVGTKSISMPAGSSQYTNFKASLTTAALQRFLPAVKGTTLLPATAGSTSYRLKWTVKSSTSTVTSLITIASGKSYLPTSENIKSKTGEGLTTFSHWGETVHVTVPNSSTVVTYTKVFG